MGFIEATQFCCFLIEFIVLHCNNVSWVFPISSMHVRDMISDWCLIPVHDWLVCSPLVWFFSPVLLAVHLFVSFSLRFSWRFDLCALMPCFSIVYYCAFGLSVLHFGRAMCSGPGHLNFAWGSLDVYSVALDFCVPVFMSRLDGLDSTGVSQVS